MQIVTQTYALMAIYDVRPQTDSRDNTLHSGT